MITCYIPACGGPFTAVHHYLHSTTHTHRSTTRLHACLLSAYMKFLQLPLFHHFCGRHILRSFLLSTHTCHQDFHTRSPFTPTTVTYTHTYILYTHLCTSLHTTYYNLWKEVLFDLPTTIPGMAHYLPHLPCPPLHHHHHCLLFYLWF